MTVPGSVPVTGAVKLHATLAPAASVMGNALPQLAAAGGAGTPVAADTSVMLTLETVTAAALGFVTVTWPVTMLPVSTCCLAVTVNSTCLLSEYGTTIVPPALSAKLTDQT